MNYQSYDYETDTDTAPWTPAPNGSQIVTAPRHTHIVPATPPATTHNSELVALGSMLQNMQQTQVQQIYMLREFDHRISRLETGARPNPAPQTPTYERATWWALWGLLMLVLGGALTIVIVLILMNIEFR